MQSTRGFDYDGFRASVRAPAATLDWLEEFFAPWFAAVRTDAAPAIDVYADPGRLLADAEPTGRTVDCFTLDRPAPWSLLRGSDGAEMAWDQDLRVLLRVRGPTIELHAEIERPYGRLVLLRTLRELVSAGARQRGELPLHASAVAVDGRVTLFVGTKGAGKSTLMLHALQDPATGYVSNDRVHVKGTQARGMPTVIMLREGSLAPGLREELASRAWHHASTLAETRAHRAAGTAAAGAGRRWPPGLSAAQFCELVGARAVAGGALERIVFPRIDGTMDRFDVQRLAPGEAAMHLLDCGLLAGGRTAGFLTGAEPADRGVLESAARDLVATVPCFSCALGPRAYESPSVWEELR